MLYGAQGIICSIRVKFVQHTKMKSLIAIGMLVAFAAAEVPSNTYLPPSSRGYPQSGVAAARALGHDQNDHSGHDLAGHGDHGGVGFNGFARNAQNQGDQGSQLGSDQTRPRGRSNEPGYNHNAQFGRNTADDGKLTSNNEVERGYKSSDDSVTIGRAGYEGPNNFGNTGYRGNEQNGDRANGYH